MKKDRIQPYLSQVELYLWIRGISDPNVLAEIESHLLEGVEENMRQGMNIDEAKQKTLERFGSARIVVNAFDRERNAGMQTLLLAMAALAGLFSAYVDSRPNWDDTGILVGGLLIVSGLLTLFGYKRPWLIALAVGIWIPLHDIYLTHDFSLLFILLIPLVGAYGGWVTRLGIRKAFHTA